MLKNLANYCSQQFGDRLAELLEIITVVYQTGMLP